MVESANHLPGAQLEITLFLFQGYLNLVQLYSSVFILIIELRFNR